MTGPIGVSRTWLGSVSKKVKSHGMRAGFDMERAPEAKDSKPKHDDRKAKAKRKAQRKARRASR